ncbi:hypothetical protein N5C38_22965 [Pseudomonas chengduensis]|nr:hypothetical protein [Pseudomonas chengduensis]MDH1213891.1 hypothetical protein [Pseudomonas chengduensis]MDH1281151.1 hypothetical protein [Pseudomonas chengduensis]
MNKNRIEGAMEQGERAMNRKALVIKAKWRRSGGCAEKECVLTWGDLAALQGRQQLIHRQRLVAQADTAVGSKSVQHLTSEATVLTFAIEAVVRGERQVLDADHVGAPGQRASAEWWKTGTVVRAALRASLLLF